jgi:DNA-binding SARP family transcriptional activator/TolB-like protein
MIQLRALGAIDLRDSDGRELTSVLSHPKWVALLIYLDAARPHGFHRRDRLIALLWPELDQSHSRNALSKAVHHLRRALGDDAIVTRGDEIAIDSHLIHSDVSEVDQSLRNNDNTHALDIYRGPLGDGFFVDDAPEFERWLGVERNRIRNEIADAVWTEAEKAKGANRFGDATSLARKAMALTPEDEPSLRRLMLFLESAGDRAGALRAYEDFSSWLSTELESTPAPETQALNKRIRQTETPHFVETIAERITSGLPIATGSPRIPAAKLSWVRMATIGAALLAIGIAAAGLSASKTSAKEPVLDPRRVIVAPFENRTGSAEYDAVGAMAMDWISQNVASYGLVSVVDPRTYSEAGAESAAKSDSVSRLRNLGVSAHAALVVSGAFYRESGRLRFQGQLSNTANETIARVFIPVSASLDSPTAAFDSVALQAVAAIAEATDSRLGALSRGGRNPPSFASYREYVQGVDAFGEHDNNRAYKHFMRAYEIDTTFTTALLNAGASMLDPWSGKDSVMAILEARRSSLTPFNQLWLDSFIAGRKNDWAEVYRITDELARQAPGSYFPFIHASTAVAIDRPRAALDALLRVDPDRGWMRNAYEYWYVRCAARHMLADYEGELADANIGEKQYPANFSVISCKVRALAALGRGDDIDKVLDAAAGMTEHTTWELGSPYSIAASEAEMHGHKEIAAKARQRAISWVNALPPEKKKTEPPMFGPAWLLLNAGAWKELDERVQQFRKLEPTESRWIVLQGLIAAHNGDRKAAMSVDSLLRSLTQRAVDRNPKPMPVPLALFHRAEIAALLGDKDRAIDLLGSAFANRLRYNIYVHSDPAFASLWKDPRFIRLMAPRD